MEEASHSIINPTFSNNSFPLIKPTTVMDFFRIINSQEVVCLAARSITIPIIKVTMVVFLVRITTTMVAVDSLTIKEEEEIVVVKEIR